MDNERDQKVYRRERISKIIVACDFSKHSNQVLSYGVEVATGLNAKLLLVNVINQRDIDAIRRAATHNIIVEKSIELDRYVADFKKERLQHLSDIIEEVNRPYLFCRPIVRVGVPFQEIIDIVVAERADLAIIGTEGRTGIVGMLVGSTAEKMFRYCPVPLLSVRLQGHRHKKE